MTNSNGNFDKLDVLTEPIGHFTETVDPLTVGHLTLTVEHGFAALKIVSREPSANSSPLIALAQSASSSRRLTNYGREQAAQTADRPSFCSFLFREQQGYDLLALLRLREQTNAGGPSVVSRASQK